MMFAPIAAESAEAFTRAIQSGDYDAAIARIQALSTQHVEFLKLLNAMQQAAATTPLRPFYEKLIRHLTLPAIFVARMEERMIALREQGNTVTAQGAAMTIREAAVVAKEAELRRRELVVDEFEKSIAMVSSGIGLGGVGDDDGGPLEVDRDEIDGLFDKLYASEDDDVMEDVGGQHPPQQQQQQQQSEGDARASLRRTFAIDIGTGAYMKGATTCLSRTPPSPHAEPVTPDVEHNTWESAQRREINRGEARLPGVFKFKRGTGQPSAISFVTIQLRDAGRGLVSSGNDIYLEVVDPGGKPSSDGVDPAKLVRLDGRFFIRHAPDDPQQYRFVTGFDDDAHRPMLVPSFVHNGRSMTLSDFLAMLRLPQDPFSDYLKNLACLAGYNPLIQ